MLCVFAPDPKQQADSEEVATSDFLSLEEDCGPAKNHLVAYKKPLTTGRAALQGRHRRGGKKVRRVAKKRLAIQTQDLLVSQLKTCCHYHEQMNRLRNQSCALVTEGDLGYDGDSETSMEENATLEIFPTVPVRHSRKRLKWRLAHSQF